LPETLYEFGLIGLQDGLIVRAEVFLFFITFDGVRPGERGFLHLEQCLHGPEVALGRFVDEAFRDYGTL
jgi:hypothetical protein